MGKLMAPDEQKAVYQADELIFTEEMEKRLEEYRDRRTHVILDIP